MDETARSRGRRAGNHVLLSFLIEYVMIRQHENLNIINALIKIIATYPDLRFTQILSNLGLDKDLFYEEPNKTLEKIYNSSLYKSIIEKGRRQH